MPDGPEILIALRQADRVCTDFAAIESQGGTAVSVGAAGNPKPSGNTADSGSGYSSGKTISIIILMAALFVAVSACGLWLQMLMEKTG